MTDAEIAIASRSDPDNPPLTARELTTVRVARQVKRIRSEQQLSQKAFAKRYQIPIGSLRDWEQGRSTPDKTALAYLSVIQSAPNAVADALAREREGA